MSFPVYPVPEETCPHFSLVVLTCNQLPFTRLCLSSVLSSCQEMSYELIVVDNGSDDGTVDYLKRLNRVNPQVKPILNQSNLGFATANNQGLGLARGEILVLLNNDTVVPPGWLERLARPLEDSCVGMSAPFTNRSGGENEIDVSYRTYEDFLELAFRVSEGAAGPSFDCVMLPMFCTALQRDCWKCVGPLDEQYQIGLFEDDDYCMRLKRSGYRLVVASECFVHHFGQASMGSAEHYGNLLRTNRSRFERKWGIEWTRVPRRRSPAYLALIKRIRKMVKHYVPYPGRVAVIARGDEELLQLGDCLTEHFMQDAEGGYAGHHPADGHEALARLHDLQRKGAEYLVIPETSLWWLDCYSQFNDFLEKGCTLVAHEPGAGLLYCLKPPSSKPDSSPRGANPCRP